MALGLARKRCEQLQKETRPSTVSEVRSFLGLVGFSSRCIPDFATKAEPLRVLCRKDEKFLWGKEQEEAFNTLKEDMAGASILAYFDRGAPTEVIAGASPVGLGAVLVQKGDWEHRAVCYASRSLSDTERRYSQTEKDALALVWSCERFHLYLYGLPEFDLVTHHQALKTIYGPTSKPSARIERWVLRL